ncbi:DUF2381 family protein [Myxococcus sp. K15C18031901]|uniref:DUF2381 family protein n=1 Tax=Myxococcus dinghuensis TaxID=2906761 RepID=UPI0020A7C82C|nr:DUF2381 family protein [Myxococcus dinghuensis]MCP3098229.1 DUF2381 family protein [Myxococcus dinghuensis]
MLRPVAILFLLLGVTASAQPVPAARERQERRVTSSSSPAEPVPELRVAAGVATLVLFDASLERSALELEGRERFRIVDVGERTLVLEPSVDLGAGERLGLRVRYADGSAPERGAFVLVTAPAAVDSRVEVFRRRDSVEALQAELAEARSRLAAQDVELRALRARNAATGPVGMVMSSLLNDRGVHTHRIRPKSTKHRADALIAEGGASFRAETWAVVSVTVRNNGQQPWSPRLARVVNARSGVAVRVIGVHAEPAQVAPGDVGLVVVETESPAWTVGEVFQVELLDADGSARILVPGVVL